MSIPVEKIRGYKLHEIYSEKAFKSLLQEPDTGTQFFILEEATPSLPKEVIRDMVAFTFWVKKLVRFEKPITLYEVIIWAKSLEMHQVKNLSKEVIKKTITQVVSQKDSIKVLSNTDRILNIIYKRYYQTIN